MNEQQNIQSETPVEYSTNLNNLNETPKPKKSHGGGIIIFLLVLIILGLVGYIAYDKGYLDKYLKKTDTKEEVKNEEKEITDTNTINTLNKKIDIINLYGLSLFGRSDDIYNNLSKQANTEEAKLYTVLFYLYNNKQYTQDSIDKYPDYYDQFKKEQQITNEDFNEYPFAAAITDTATVIKNDDVKKLYKEVYGIEPSNTKVLSDAPAFYYNEKNNGYYVIITGGGTCPTESIQYNYKYTEDNEKAYVYTAVVYNDCNEELFKDINRETSIADIDKETKVDSEYVKNIMDKLNKYRIVFKKDGNNYVFEKVEEVK